MAKQTVKNLPKKQVVELDNYNEIKKSDLVKMVDKYKNLIITKETLKEAEMGLSVVKQKRYEIQRKIKSNKALLNTGKKIMEANGNGLIEVLADTETYIQSGVDRVNAEKARIKAEKEAEKQRLQAERMEKINKIQREFSSALIQASTLKNIDEIKANLDGFEVTEEEFGDLKIACETTISGIQFDINIARTRIEDGIEAEKQLVLAETKSDYRLESGKEWEGVEDVDLIQKEIAVIIENKKTQALVIMYESLGGEVPENIDNETLSQLILEKQQELADFAKQKKEEEKAKEKLGADRLKSIFDVGIEFEQVVKMLAADYPDKMIEDLTDVEFETFSGNLIAMKSELDKAKIPVDSPEASIPEIKFEDGMDVEKKEVINVELKDILEIISIQEAEIFHVKTNQDELYEYTRYSADSWTIRMGESDETVYDCEELENLFQAYLYKSK